MNPVIRMGHESQCLSVGAVCLATLGIAFLLVAFPSFGQTTSGFTFTAPQLSTAPYRTPANTFEHGQCTWYVFGRVLEKSGTALQFARKGDRGAELWGQLLSPEYRRTDVPEAGAIAVWKHETIADFGHVAYVEGVYGNVVLFTEANFSVQGNYDGAIKASTITDFESSKGGKPWRFLGYVLPQQSADPVGAVPFANGQTWRGSYSCWLGEVMLELTIEDVAAVAVATPIGSAIEIAAVFDFSHSAGNGAFRLLGKYDVETSTASFVAGDWVREPVSNGSVNWATAGIEGRVGADGRSFAGSIVGPGCTTFEVRRE